MCGKESPHSSQITKATSSSPSDAILSSSDEKFGFEGSDRLSIMFFLTGLRFCSVLATRTRFGLTILGFGVRGGFGALTRGGFGTRGGLGAGGFRCLAGRGS